MHTNRVTGKRRFLDHRLREPIIAATITIREDYTDDTYFFRDRLLISLASKDRFQRQL